MTSEQRSLLASENVKRVRIFERHFALLFQAVLRKQMNKVISVLHSHGVIHAKSEVGKIIFNVDLHQTLLSLYKTVGLYYAKHTAFDLAADAKVWWFGFKPKLD